MNNNEDKYIGTRQFKCELNVIGECRRIIIFIPTSYLVLKRVIFMCCRLRYLLKGRTNEFLIARSSFGANIRRGDINEARADKGNV